MREKIKNFWNSLTQRFQAWRERRMARSQAQAQANQPVNRRVNWFDLLVRVLRRLVVFALLMQVLAYFVPDLPQQMPTWYGLSELIIQFFEWLLKVAFGGLYSIFTLNWVEFAGEVMQSIGEGWQAFVELLSGISL